MNEHSEKTKTATRRKDAELESRREACIEAAERLFQSKSFVDTSMQDIANEVGLSVGSLYNLFESKDELMHQVFLRCFKEEGAWAENLVQSTNLSVREVLTAFIEKMLSVFRAHQVQFRAMVQSMTMPFAEHQHAWKDIAAHREKMTGYLTAVIERGIKEGVIRSDMKAGRVAAAIGGCMMGLFMYIAQYEDAMPADLAANNICEIMLSGIGRRVEDAR